MLLKWGVFNYNIKLNPLGFQTQKVMCYEWVVYT